MTKRKHWTNEEEAKLRALVDSNTQLEEIAKTLNKTPKAIITKSQRLGLMLTTQAYLNTSIALPRELPSAEEALKILAGALRMAKKPGLSKLEIQRLQAVASISKTYKEWLADYVNYREIERKLIEAEKRNERILEQETSNNETKPNSGTIA